MFSRLIDLLLEFIGLFQVFFYVDEFEKGVVLRLGRFHRVVEPGFRWIVPLNIETVLVDNAKPAPMYLDLQSLHTSDEYATNIQVAIIWRIIDIKEFIIEHEDTEDTVGMLASGVVSEYVRGNKWKDVCAPDFAKSLRAAMNRKVRKRGAEIDEVFVTDCSNGEALRYWHEGIELDFGE